MGERKRCALPFLSGVGGRNCMCEGVVEVGWGGMG